MNPAIRTVLVFLGLLILVITASLYFVRTTRDESGERNAVTAPGQAAAPVLHPDVVAGLEALREFRTADARALFERVPETDPGYGEALKNIANMQWQEGDFAGSPEKLQRPDSHPSERRHQLHQSELGAVPPRAYCR